MTLRNIGAIPPREGVSDRFRRELAEALSLPSDAAALPGRLRDVARPLLPQRAFLRRARGEGTFITDALRHADEPLIPLLTAAGFICAARRDCLLLSPDAGTLTDLELRHSVPPDFFCETLLRFRGQPPCGDALSLFATGVRLLEASTADERRIYQRRARNLAAVCLRTHQGGAYACGLIAHILDP